MQLKWPMLWDLFSLFPAYAGVILRAYREIVDGISFPRIRGGDPQMTSVRSGHGILFPAYAGVIPFCTGNVLEL